MAEPGGDSPSENGLGDEGLEQLQAEEDDLAKRVETEVSEELNSHLMKLELELKNAFSERMSVIEQQCSSLVTQVIDTRQTDILRTNKVIRDVSRALGANWRPVFDDLMSRFPPDVRSAELSKIEAERPFLQVYKALMSWKDTCGQEFNIRELVDVLKQHGSDDLVTMALSILDSNEKESLISFSGFGKSVPSSGQGAAAAAGGSLSKVPAGLLKPSSLAQKCESSSNTVTAASPRRVNAEEALDDRHLLMLSKKVASEWDNLAKQLGVPAADIDEIIVSEGLTYQGAFKMLWDWRESASDLTSAFEKLSSSLRQLGRQDIVEQIFC